MRNSGVRHRLPLGGWANRKRAVVRLAGSRTFLRRYRPPNQAVWRVDMRPGQTGPLHAIDTEQVWTVLAGGATVELDGEVVTVEPGDTVVMPADAPRRVTAVPRRCRGVRRPPHAAPVTRPRPAGAA